MEDQPQAQAPSKQCGLEPVRSRWTPKPEQILILESIFNSGMVNPPKEETVNIRKLLEKFGPVADANVFYWFQNRRSRSRRRQRQIQASLISAASQPQSPQPRCGGANISAGGGIVYQDAATSYISSGFGIQQQGFLPTLQSSMPGCSSSSCSRVGADEICFISGGVSSYPEIEHNTTTFMASGFLHLDTTKVHHQLGCGVMTVFINGVATEVESGPVNMKGMLGEDMVLVHSSGVPVPHDHYAFSLKHGESYYLVSRPFK